MSTAFHPQTDGQIEHLNQTIEAYLRAFVNQEQDDWVHLLPMTEFAYNNSTTMASGMSLFYANYGFHPVATGPGAAATSKHGALRRRWTTKIMVPSRSRNHFAACRPPHPVPEMENPQFLPCVATRALPN